MMRYLIMCRSLTGAQRASAFLERKGIRAMVIKAPMGLSDRGCSYAVGLHKSFVEASRLLKINNLLSGKRFILSENGEYMEVKDDIS